jgi:uncharacterized repeat protein (TIGR03943 family)
MLLVGAMLIRLTLTGAYQRYVRVGMAPLLLAAGAVLAVLGVVVVVRALRHEDQPEPHADDHPAADVRPHDVHPHDDDHDHPHTERVGWLLLAPVLALLLVAPPALGSFAVDRTRVSAGTAATDPFPALPAGSGPRTMTLVEFAQRAQDREGSTLRSATVRLTGFVALPKGAGIRLARYQIACCAADAAAAVVKVTGGPAAPARDSWLRVTGTFAGTDPDGVPRLAASSVEPVPAPADPYE